MIDATVPAAPCLHKLALLLHHTSDCRNCYFDFDLSIIVSLLRINSSDACSCRIHILQDDTVRMVSVDKLFHLSVDLLGICSCRPSIILALGGQLQFKECVDIVSCSLRGLLLVGSRGRNSYVRRPSCSSI